MAYFPNGSSGMQYQAQYCDNCWNYRDLKDGRGHGCPIWDFHMVSNYDQNRNTTVGGFYKDSLEHFIPTKKDGIYADKCTMFLSKNEIDIKGQMKLFESTK